jgi:hypothetical protein
MRRVLPARPPGTYAPSEWTVPRSVWGLLPPRWIRALRAFPLAVEHGARQSTIVVAMARPGDLAAIDDISFATGMHVRVLPASDEAIERAIAAHLGSSEPPGPTPRHEPPEGRREPDGTAGRAWFVSPRGI